MGVTVGRLGTAVVLALVVVALLAWNVPTSGLSSGPGSNSLPSVDLPSTVLMQCNATQFAADVALGGTVDFGVDCAPLTIPGSTMTRRATNLWNKSERPRRRRAAGVAFWPAGADRNIQGSRFSCQGRPRPISGARRVLRVLPGRRLLDFS